MQRTRADRSCFARGAVWSLLVTLPAAIELCACSGKLVEQSGVADDSDNDTAGAGGNGQDNEPIEGDIPPTAKACADKKLSSGPANWRRLTALQYKNTIKDLLGLDVDTTLFLGDTTTGRFVTNAGVATPDAQVLKYQDTAAKLATEAVRDVGKLAGCKSGQAEDDCALSFFNDFGARALRRPLTDEDRKLLDGVYRVGKQESFATGIRLTVEAMLQLPSFLYLVEMGGAPSDGTALLNPYELASRLSYVLWNTMPDTELFEAARDGSLNKPDGIRKHAARLMSSPRFASALVGFHEQLLGVDQLAKTGGVVRDVKRYPEWTDALTSAMRDETQKFVSSVFFDGDGTVKELLSAPYGFPTGPLVALYGAGQSQGANGKITFDNGSRRGILTQGATLAAAVPSDSLYRAVLRGKLIREQIFCETLPPVPGNVEFKQPPGAESMTQQELLRVHQEDPSCKSCHEQMDPLGFALESYDGIGRHRNKTEDGEAVDTSGTVVGTDVKGDFSDTAGFIEKLSISKDVRGCFARQWFRFSVGRDPTNADTCSLAKSRDVLVQGGGDMREALTLLVTSDSFRYRGGL